MDLKAAREAAERSQAGSNYSVRPNRLITIPTKEHEDLLRCRDALLAILADPSILLPAAKWERQSESECWRWHPSPWNYFAGDDYWIVTGPGCTGFVVDCDSLAAAQAACEADLRERVRALFRAEKIPNNFPICY